jgi:hypothetical protein
MALAKDKISGRGRTKLTMVPLGWRTVRPIRLNLGSNPGAVGSPTRVGRRSVRHRLLAVASAVVLATFCLTFAWAGPAAAPVRAGTTGIDYGGVYAWGNDSAHQTDVPAAAFGGIVAISAAGQLALALTWDGKVVAWGNNSAGQATVPAGLSHVVAISSGGSFAVALKADGSVVAWGSDSWHQTEVPAAAKSGVVAVSAGSNFVVALKKDGSIVAWGDDTFGATDIPWVCVPHGRLCLNVPLSGLKAVSASGQVLGLKPDGTVVAWGWNKYGQTNVPSYLSGVKAVAAGFRFSLALNSNGTVTAWGDNTDGELSTPCSLYNMLTHVCASPISGFSVIAAGDKHALAIKDGFVRAWGSNASGQTTLPDDVKAGGFVSVAAGSDFSLALWGTPGVPFAPDAVEASAGDGVAMVNWAGLGDHGVPIDHCTVTVSPGGKQWTFPKQTDAWGWSHGLVTGLANGTTYTFTVTATNGIGTGPPSSPTNPVTPMAGKVYSLTITPTPGPSASPSGSAAASNSSAASNSTPASASAPAASGSGSASPGSRGSGNSSGSGDNAPLVVALIVLAGVVVVLGGALASIWVRRRGPV